MATAAPFPAINRYPLLLVMLALCLLVLSGCGSTGGTTTRAPKTVEESLYVAAAAGKQMAITANQLRTAGSMPAEQHRKVLDELERAAAAIDAANVAYKFGNIAGATDQLGKIEATLRIVSSILMSFGGTSR